MNEELKKYYNEIYSKNLSNQEGVFSPLDHDFLEFMEDNFQNKNDVSMLDLGYGAGLYSMHMLNLGFNVTAIDFVEPMILKNKIPNEFKNKCNIICKDLNDYHYKEKFNIIICKDVLHYLNKDNAIKLLKLNSENTIKGGINYLTVFTNIKRLDQNGNPRKIENEANFQLEEFIEILSEIYVSWEKKIIVTDYYEKDTYDKNRNYFEAKKVKFLAKKLR